MHNLFYLQLLTSFLVGGGLIAFLSFIAEKVPSSIAGIILTFPTTIALGFFFLGWTLSPQVVAEVVPSTLLSLGFSILFAALYPYIAEFSETFLKRRIWQVAMSFVINVGSLSLFAYVISVMLVFPPLGFILGTLVAYGVSLVVSLLLTKELYKFS